MINNDIIRSQYGALATIVARAPQLKPNVKGMVTNKIVKKTIYRTIQVLEFIVEASTAVPEALIGKDTIYKGCRSIFSSKIAINQIDRVISRNLSELKRAGHIHENKNNSIVLTKRTKLRYIDKFSKEIANDGKFRYISYDIPEVLRVKRDRFRNSIKKMGFVKIQKSLWVTDRNVTDLLEIVIEEFGVEDYVIYMVSESSNVDKMLTMFLNPKKDKTNIIKKLQSQNQGWDFSEFRKNIRW